MSKPESCTEIILKQVQKGAKKRQSKGCVLSWLMYKFELCFLNTASLTNAANKSYKEQPFEIHKVLSWFVFEWCAKFDETNMTSLYKAAFYLVRNTDVKAQTSSSYYETLSRFSV